MVVAPSLIPMKAGDRVKTDRRDAMMLAKLQRAGELTAVWVPDGAHEAMRDLIRARATAVRVLGKARQHLQGFLLRHGRVYAGKKGWTLAYRRWLTTVRFDHSAQQVVLQDYIHAVSDSEARVARLTQQIEDLVPNWSMAPVVEALQAMRGVAFIVAVTVAAEIGDFPRFDNPRQLMADLGLVPSERSSGATVRHHQGRQCPGKASADRKRLDLSHASPNQPQIARPQRKPAPGHPRHRLEGSGPAVRSLSPPGGGGQGQGGGHHRHRPQDGRLPLGHCSASGGQTGRQIGAGGWRWGAVGKPRACYEPACRCSSFRPRQPQDETTVMRYPTRV